MTTHTARHPFAFATRDNQAQYGAFAKAFSEEVPFKTNWIRESLSTEKCFDTLRALYFVDRGRPGSHAKLYEHSAVIAGDSEVLTKEQFRAAFDLRYLANAKFSGFNPFRDSDYARLPEFPLSVDESELDEQMKAFMRTKSGAFMKTKSGSWKGGKLYLR
jgi:hypothetical protein